MQTMKKSFNKFQQKQFERYAVARRVDLPILIADRYSIEFSGNGNNLDAHGHGLRLGMKESSGEQVWLANGAAVGDAVQAIQQLDKSYLSKETSKSEAIGVIEAFAQSHTASKHINTISHQSASPKEFKLTPAVRDTSGDVGDYIRERGIGWKTFNDAVLAGFADKTSGGVRFIGLDTNGDPKNAETRLLPSSKVPGEKLPKFMCAPRSDRSFPPILPGTDKGDVHIVEGGFSALGLKEIIARQGRSPTIIVAGGKDNTSWLKHEHVRALIQGAEVTLHTENEKTPEIQAEAALASDKQCEAILDAGAEKVNKARPPAQFKDNADINLHYKQNQHTQQQSHSKSR